LKIVGIIPARLESSRLDRKALKDICGIPMIIHVLERCLLSKKLTDVYVATDSTEIADTVLKSGGKAILTSKLHQTGTDRIAEAVRNIDCDVVINIQGDEALLDPSHIDLIIDEFPKTITECPVGILVTKFKKFNSPSDIKVVMNCNDEVMYFSRTDIPSNSRSQVNELLKAYHIVPFQKDFLLKYSQLARTPLELIEFNEYLRILENGYKVKAFRVVSDSLSVDTQLDLEYVRSKMPNDPHFQSYMDKHIRL
jgi:3-deoxy-manno-octulosonate cytidylyltransferase (CMP-KDO synthetase)